jgi:dTDP-4-dehydrorhamnose 3,5-epimerase
MHATRLQLDGVLMVEPQRIQDERGFFSEVFRADMIGAVIGPNTFLQDNHSYSARKGTLRGLHCQLPPAAQGKLVRVTRGAILDVAVDVRPESSTYAQYVAVVLSADNWRQLWIPPSFLHGFCTLVDETEVLYKVTAHYSVEHERSVAWNDPDVGIEWPFPDDELILSPKDRAAGLLRAFATKIDLAGVGEK